MAVGAQIAFGPRANGPSGSMTLFPPTRRSESLAFGKSWKSFRIRDRWVIQQVLRPLPNWAFRRWPVSPPKC